MEKVHVSKAAIEAEIAKGVSKEEIRANLYPSLNKSQWAKALKMCNLSTKRVPKVEFIITDLNNIPETTSSNAQEVTASEPEDTKEEVIE